MTKNPSDELSLVDIVFFLRRHRRWILGGALAGGLLTGLAVILLVPRSYEATATLIVVQPKFVSDLKPGTLTVQGYQRVLESGAVLLEARKRLIAQAVTRSAGWRRSARRCSTSFRSALTERRPPAMRALGHTRTTRRIW